MKQIREQEPASRRLVEGVVAELLPHATCRVTLTDERQVIAHAAAGAARNFVRLRVGDKVAVEISPTDRTRGRVMRVLPD